MTSGVPGSSRHERVTKGTSVRCRLEGCDRGKERLSLIHDAHLNLIAGEVAVEVDDHAAPARHQMADPCSRVLARVDDALELRPALGGKGAGTIEGEDVDPSWRERAVGPAYLAR